MGEAHHICQFVISLSLLGPSQSQIAGQGKFPLTCFAYNMAGDQISQNTQTSGASLTESGKTTLQFMYHANVLNMYIWNGVVDEWIRHIY